MVNIGINHVFGNSVISVIPVGSFPQALVFNPSNNNIYVANRDSGTVSVIETNNNTVIKSVSVGATPHALVFNPSNNNIYVTNRDSGTVSVIETNNNTVIKNVTVGSFPEQLLFNPDNKNIYVSTVKAITKPTTPIIMSRVEPPVFLRILQQPQ